MLLLRRKRGDSGVKCAVGAVGYPVDGIGCGGVIMVGAFDLWLLCFTVIAIVVIG